MAFIKSINMGGVPTTLTKSPAVTIAPKIWSAIIIENDGEAKTHIVWKDLHEEGLPHYSWNLTETSQQCTVTIELDQKMDEFDQKLKKKNITTTTNINL